ncbi:MAG: hypothetical protein AAGB16_05520 [Pseudomonadota bacterium]
MRVLACLLTALIVTSPALAEVCRSASTVWQEAGYSIRTEISTRADRGCKLIKQSIDGVEEEGLDCNCDLIIDGREGHFRAPPAYQATPLLEICFGPEADPDSYNNTPWIKVVED